MNFINLKWKNGSASGYTDILPIPLLQCRGEIGLAEHEVLGPDGRRTTVQCRVNVSESFADLDYEPFRDHNLAKGMELGVLRLHFANRDHTIVRKAEWKAFGEAEFKETDTEVVSSASSSEPVIFNKREDRTLFLAWTASNPNGFVLNWPKTGITASTNVKFHKSACSLFAERSFPTPEWHKVCAPSLATLIGWARSQRRFEHDPPTHACSDCFTQGASEFELATQSPTGVIDLAVDDELPDRVEVKLLRIVRDTLLARQIKALHLHVCQLCPTVIEIPGGGRYAEAHHLKPLGGEHRGPDKSENIMCVCPTCHAKLDYGVISLRRSDIRETAGHFIGDEFIQYHNDQVFSR
jgi:hypothetical protein